MQWFDLSRHNAALWLDGDWLVALPVDETAPIIAVDEERLAAMTAPASVDPAALFAPGDGPPPRAGLIARLGGAVELDDDGALCRLAVPHNRDGERLSTADWMRLFPRATVRDTATMVRTGVPEIAQRAQAPYQWLWRVVEPDPDSLGVSTSALAATPLSAYAYTEEDARRYGNAAEVVSATDEAPRLVGAGERLGLLWGVDATTWQRLSESQRERLQPLDAREAAREAPPQASSDASDADPQPAGDELDDATGDGRQPANADAGVRDDWGEKIGGARKDEFADLARVDAADWDDAVSRFTLDNSRRVSVMHYSADATAAARKIARKPRRDRLWPAPSAQADYERGQSPLGHWLAVTLRNAISPSTSGILRATSRNPGDPVQWLLLAGGYVSQVEALRERFETPRSNEAVVALFKEALDKDIRAREGEEWILAASASNFDELQARRAKVEASLPPRLNPRSWFHSGVSIINQRFTHNGRSREFITGSAAVDPAAFAGHESSEPTPVSSTDDIAAAIAEAVQGFRQTAKAAAVHDSIAPVVPWGKRGPVSPYIRIDALAKAALSVGGVVPPDPADTYHRMSQLDPSASMRERREKRIAIERERVGILKGALDELLEVMPDDPAEGYRRLFGDIYASPAAGESEGAADEAAGTEASGPVVPPVKLGKKPVPPRYRHLERKADTVREGERDVSEAEVAEIFGLRAIEYGNWVNQAERQALLNLTYDSLTDMARALGVSHRFMGFDGELALALGARGRGGRAAAHYEPDRRVINLTKTMGAGTFAHEWAHALDHWLSRTTARADAPRPAPGHDYLSERALSAIDLTSHAVPNVRQPHRYARDLAHLDQRDVPDPVHRAMLAFTRAMVLRPPPETDAKRPNIDPAVSTAVVNDWRRRMFQPKRLTEETSDIALRRFLANKADPDASYADIRARHAERKQAIAAGWHERLGPMLARLTGEISAQGDILWLFDAPNRRGRYVYNPERVLAFTREALEAAGEAALTDEEEAYFRDWERYRDFKWLHKRLDREWRTSGALRAPTSDHEPTRFIRDACVLEGERGGTTGRMPYWNSGRELFARGFSTVIHERMAELGVRNDFASKWSAPGQFTSEHGYARSGNPEGDEVALVVAGAKPLIEAVQRLAPAAAAADTETMDSGDDFDPLGESAPPAAMDLSSGA